MSLAPARYQRRRAADRVWKIARRFNDESRRADAAIYFTILDSCCQSRDSIINVCRVSSVHRQRAASGSSTGWHQVVPLFFLDKYGFKKIFQEIYFSYCSTEKKKTIVLIRKEIKLYVFKLINVASSDVTFKKHLILTC